MQVAGQEQQRCPTCYTVALALLGNQVGTLGDKTPGEQDAIHPVPQLNSDHPLPLAP